MTAGAATVTRAQLALPSRGAQPLSSHNVPAQPVVTPAMARGHLPSGGVAHAPDANCGSELPPVYALFMR